MNKVGLLQEQQKELRGRKASVPNLQMQQEALKRSLLLKKPISEDKGAKVKRFQENQKIARDLHLQKQRVEKEKKRVVDELAKSRKFAEPKDLTGLFFPKRKRK